MASKIGMSYRIEKAKARQAKAVEAINANGLVEMPAPVGRFRDPILMAALHEEWLADLLEAVAAIKIERVELDVEVTGA